MYVKNDNHKNGNVYKNISPLDKAIYLTSEEVGWPGWLGHDKESP